MADINIRIGAKLDGLQRSIKKAQSQLGRFADFAERVGTDLTTRLSLPVLGVGTAAVTSFAKFEKLENGLKAIAEEGEDAGETLTRLQNIAQLPGISLEQAVKGANQLRNVGFEAQQAEAVLTQLSKAVTLSGEGPEQLQAVVRQLVQMSAKGRILQEDLGVIQENVPSIGIAIQDAFGTQNIEAIRATGVSAQEFTAKITKAIAENEKFQKAQGGLANEFDNFNQSVQFSLATLGKTIAESINLSGILQSVSTFVSDATKRFKELNPRVQKFIVITAGVAAAIGPVILGFGALVKVGLSVVAGIKLIGGALAILAANPIGLAVAAIGAVIIAFTKFYKSSTTFRATINGIGAEIKAFATRAAEVLLAPIKLLSRLVKGDFEGAQQAAISVFGGESGFEAGKAFSEAYAKTIADSVQQEQISSQISVAPVSSAQTPNLDAIFANLPSSPPLAESIGESAQKVARDFKGVVEPLVQSATIPLIEQTTEITRAIDASIQQAPIFRDSWVEAALAIKDSFQAIASEGITRLGDEIESLATRGALSFKSFAQAALSAISDIIGALIKQGVAAAVANAFKNPAGIIPPVGLALAGLAGAGASALFKSLVSSISPPKLAQGGIIPPGFEGDRFPALLNSGEAVIPLDRLFREMNQDGGNVRFEIQGDALVGVLDRSQYNRSRKSGF